MAGAAEMSPIALLAGQFQGAFETISIPKPLRKSIEDRISAGEGAPVFSESEVESLIDSLDDWSLLDASAFSLLISIFLTAEAGQGQAEGFFKCLDVLERRQRIGDDSLPDSARESFKSASLHVLDPLLSFFLDHRKQAISRRWAGLLVFELLEFPANRQNLLSIHSSSTDDTLKALGKLIILGMDKVLKIVAGRIIAQLLVEFNGEKKKAFVRRCMGEIDDDSLQNSQFPLLEKDPETQVSSTPSGSQWDMAFTDYVGFIETTRENMGKRSPMGFSAVAITLGEDSLPISEAGNITCNVDSILSIHVPPTRDSFATWIDVDMLNVDEIELVDSGKNLDHVRADVTVNLVLRLKDHMGSGCLFLMDMEPETKPDAVVIEIYQDESEFIALDLKKLKERLRRRFREEKEEETPMVGALFADIRLTFPSSIMAQETAAAEKVSQTEDSVVTETPGLKKKGPAVAARDIPLPPRVTRAVAVREPVAPGAGRKEPQGAVKQIALPPKVSPAKEPVNGVLSISTTGEVTATVKQVPPPPKVSPAKQTPKPIPSLLGDKDAASGAKSNPEPSKTSLQGNSMVDVPNNGSDDPPALLSPEKLLDAGSFMRPPANTKRLREYAGKKPKVPATPMKPFKVPTMIGASGSKPAPGTAAPPPTPAGPSAGAGSSKGAGVQADVYNLPGADLSDVEESVRNKTASGDKKTSADQKKGKGKGRKTRSSKAPRPTVFDESDGEAEPPSFKTAKKIAEEEKARKAPVPAKSIAYATASEDISAAEAGATGNKPKQTPRKIAKASPPPDPLSQSSLPGILNIPSDNESKAPKKKGKAPAKRKGKAKSAAIPAPVVVPETHAPVAKAKQNDPPQADDIFDIPDDSDEGGSPPKRRKAPPRAAKGKPRAKKAPVKKTPAKSNKAASPATTRKTAADKNTKAHEREADDAEEVEESPPKKQKKAAAAPPPKPTARKGPITRRSARLKASPPKKVVVRDTSSELSDLPETRTPRFDAEPMPELEGTPLDPISPVAKRVPGEGPNTSDSAEESITLSQVVREEQKESGGKEKAAVEEQEEEPRKGVSAPPEVPEGQTEEKNAAVEAEVPQTPPRQQASTLLAAAVAAAHDKKALPTDNKPAAPLIRNAVLNADAPPLVEEKEHRAPALEDDAVPVTSPVRNSEGQLPSEPKAAPQLELQITLPEVPAKNVGVNISIEPVADKPAVVVDLVDKQNGKELASVVVSPPTMSDGRVIPCSVETVEQSDEPSADMGLPNVSTELVAESPKQSPVEISTPKPAPQHPATPKTAASGGIKTPRKVEETPQKKSKLTPAKRTLADVPEGWPSPKKIVKQTYRKTPGKPPAVPPKSVASAEQSTTGNGTDNIPTASDRSSPGPKTPPPVQQRDPYPKTPYARAPGTSALKSAPLPRLSDKKVDSLMKKPQIISWSDKGPLNQGRLVMQSFGTVLNKDAVVLPRESLHVRFAEASSQSKGKNPERKVVADPEELAPPPAADETPRMRAPEKLGVLSQPRPSRPPFKRTPVTPAVIPPSDPPVLTTGELIRLQVENGTYRGPDVDRIVEDEEEHEVPEKLDMSDEDLYSVPNVPTPRLPPAVAPYPVEESTPPLIDSRRKIRKIVTVDDEDILVYEGDATPVQSQRASEVTVTAAAIDPSLSQVRRVTDSGSPLPRRQSSQLKPPAMVMTKRKVRSSVDGESSSEESAPKSPEPAAKPKLVPLAKQKRRSPSPVYEASIEAVLARMREKTPIYVDTASETPTEKQGSRESSIFGAPLVQKKAVAPAKGLFHSLQKAASPPPHKTEDRPEKQPTKVDKPTKETIGYQLDKITKPSVSRERRRSAINGEWPLGSLPPPPDSRRAALSKLSEALQQVTAEVPPLVQHKTASAFTKAVPRPRLVRDAGGVLERDAPGNDAKREVPEDKKGTTGGHGRFFTAMQQHGLLNPTSVRPGVTEKDDRRRSRAREESSTSSSGEASTAEYSSSEVDDSEEWREEVPPYHRETLRVLDQITQHWVSYLMSSEEKLKVVLGEHRKTAEQVVEQLRQFHNEEGQEKFREQAGGLKKAVLEEGNKTRIGLSRMLKENMVVLGADIDSGVKEQYSRINAGLEEKMELL